MVIIPYCKRLHLAPNFRWEPFCSIDKLPQMSEDTEKGHILLVPLGTRPMIATQLYTLLTERRRGADSGDYPVLSGIE